MNLKELLGEAYRDDMTLADVEAILESMPGVDGTDQASEIKRLKNALSKSNSEAADYKRQLRSMSSAADAKVEELNSELQTLRDAFNALTRENDITKAKAQFLGLGYDEDLAASMAKALIDQDKDTLFANHKQYIDGLERRIRADVLADTPRPNKAGGNDIEPAVTLEQLKKMSPVERYEFSQSFPEEYRKMYEGSG